MSKQVTWMLTFRAAVVTQVQSTCLPTGARGHLMAAQPCWQEVNCWRCLCFEKAALGLLVVQRLRLCTPNTGGPGSTPGWGTRSHMSQLKIRKTERKKEKKEERNGSAARPT